MTGCIRGHVLQAHQFATASSAGDQVQLDFLEGDLEGVGVLSLNRPEAKNAISSSLLDALRSTLERVERCASVRVLVLRSIVPGTFCAGADLKERAEMAEQHVSAFVGRLRHLFCHQLRQLPVPTVAALDGLALGGGLEMALACDVRVAAAAVKLGLVETRLAIIPGAGGTQLLPRLVGASVAKQLIFSGAVIDAAEAVRLGLVNVTVAQNSSGDAAYRHALSWAEQVAANGPLAVRQAKRAIEAAASDWQAGLAAEASCYDRLIGTEDRLEGLRAFREKRPPKYSGH